MAKNKAAPKGSDLATNKAVQYQEEVNQFLETRADTIDELAIYDEMMSGVLTGIRNDLRKGLTAEDILEKYANVAAARIATIALTDADSSRALAASKDILDRTKGKAIERKQIHHKLDKVDEKQLDAILLTELEALNEDSEDE